MPETPAVETTPPAASENPEPVNKVPAGEPSDIDYQKEYQTLLEEQLKTAEERDNYKKGLLKAKGKLPDDELEEEDDRIRRIVADTIASTKSAQIEQAKEELIRKTLADNAELKKALANKEQIPTTTPGSSVDNPPFKTNDQLLSKEQIAYFKSKGWSDKKIEEYKQNYAKRLNKA